MRTFTTDLKKSLFSVNFLLSAVVLIVLICTSIGSSSSGGFPDYSIFDFFLKADSELINSAREFSKTGMYTKGFDSQWTGIFIPFLTAFAYVPVFCDEYRSGCWRHNVERVGIKKYILSKLAVSVTVSFALIVLVYGIYGIICGIKFPGYLDYPEDMMNLSRSGFNSFKKYFGSESYVLFVLSRLFHSGLVTVVGGLLSLFFSVLTMNKNASMALPVLVYFFLAQVAKNCIFNVSDNSESLRKFILLNNSHRFWGIELEYVYYVEKPLWTMYAYFAVVIALLCFAYYFIMKRRLRQ